MDILRGIMNVIGIGPARVKLVPGRQEYRQGEDMKGRLIIFSGHTDAAVDMIYLHLKIDTYQGNEHIIRTLHSSKIDDSFIIKANSPEKEYSFSYRLPYFILISTAQINYTFHTGLDIKHALDPHDAVPVRILPSLELEAVFGALCRLGFLHTPDSGGLVHDHQQFAFYPTSFMRGKVNELEMMFNQNKNNLYIYIEIDRKARGVSWMFTKALYLDENHTRFAVPVSELVKEGQPDIEKACLLLAGFIEQVYHK